MHANAKSRNWENRVPTEMINFAGNRAGIGEKKASGKAPEAPASRAYSVL